MGVLDEGTRVAVEVDRLARIEEHRLLGIHLEDEVLQGTQTYHRRYSLGLLLRAAVELTQLGRHLARGLDHVGNQVVGIHYRTLARLHLALGKLHHTIREVGDVVAPLGIAELLQHELQHLEVVVLLVTHHIYHIVELILLEAAQGSTQVLCHIDRGAVATQQQLLVQSVSLEVNPYRAILLTEEYALVQAILHQRLTQQIGL